MYDTTHRLAWVVNSSIILSTIDTCHHWEAQIHSNGKKPPHAHHFAEWSNELTRQTLLLSSRDILINNRRPFAASMSTTALQNFNTLHHKSILQCPKRPYLICYRGLCTQGFHQQRGQDCSVHHLLLRDDYNHSCHHGYSTSEYYTAWQGGGPGKGGFFRMWHTALRGEPHITDLCLFWSELANLL